MNDPGGDTTLEGTKDDFDAILQEKETNANECEPDKETQKLQEKDDNVLKMEMDKENGQAVVNVERQNDSKQTRPSQELVDGNIDQYLFEDTKSDSVPSSENQHSAKTLDVPVLKAKSPKTSSKKHDRPKPQKKKKMVKQDCLSSGSKRKMNSDIVSEKENQPTEPKQQKIHTEKSTRRKSTKDLMSNRAVEQIGIWVQCSKDNCNKWRNLVDVHDPTQIPEMWDCTMNTDPNQNSCDAKEAEYDPETEHEDFIHTKYVEGSLVWARMPGYPWWPGIVEVDPDYRIFFECREKANIASHYHVTFLAEKVSRAWLSSKSLRPYTGEETKMGKTKFRGQDFRREISVANNKAKMALALTLPERISQYGFASRFHGKWGVYMELTVTQEANSEDKLRSGGEMDVEDKDGGIGGLSGQEVDEILDNVESLIESANDTLHDIFNDQRGDSEQPKKKEAKKNKLKPEKTKPEKVKRKIQLEKSKPAINHKKQEQAENKPEKKPDDPMKVSEHDRGQSTLAEMSSEALTPEPGITAELSSSKPKQAKKDTKAKHASPVTKDQIVQEITKEQENLKANVIDQENLLARSDVVEPNHENINVKTEVTQSEIDSSEVKRNQPNQVVNEQAKKKKKPKFAAPKVNKASLAENIKLNEAKKMEDKTNGASSMDKGSDTSDAVPLDTTENALDLDIAIKQELPLDNNILNLDIAIKQEVSSAVDTENAREISQSRIVGVLEKVEKNYESDTESLDFEG